MSSETARRLDARGDATRERLIRAAVDLFGRKGFDGVGAREISATAGVPLAAIPYHFGTKDALYRAALERVRDELATALAPAVQAARAALREGPAAAREGLAAFQAALLDVMAVNPQSASWAKMLLREHFDPSASYDVVYEDAGRGAVELLSALIGVATGRAPDDEGVLIEAFARMGEVLAFRITQEAINRRLDWKIFGPEQAERVTSALGWSKRVTCSPFSGRS